MSCNCVSSPGGKDTHIFLCVVHQFNGFRVQRIVLQFSHGVQALRNDGGHVQILCKQNIQMVTTVSDMPIITVKYVSIVKPSMFLQLGRCSVLAAVLVERALAEVARLPV